MDPRFIKLSNLLIEYSLGNYDAKIKLSKQKDAIDAFISSVNMLGEELKSTAISRNHFNNIFDSVSDTVFVLNKKGIIELANKSISANLGLPEEPVYNKKIDDFFTCLNKTSLFNKLKKQLHASASLQNNDSILGLIRSKPNCIVSCNMSFLTNSKKQRTGYILTVRDVTQIKNFEEELIASEEKYRNIFQNSSDSIFISDETDHLSDLNDAGIQLLKVRSHEIFNHKISDFIYNPLDKKIFLEKLKAKNNIVDFKTKLIDTEGNIVDCIISSNKINDNRKHFKGYQGYIKNITKQEEVDNLIVRTINDTQEKERIRFSKDIHDSLGQQLSAVKFYIGTLRNTYNLPDEKKNEIVEKSNDAILDVLSDLRNICFNLMPQTLQNVGLKAAVNELCRKIVIADELEFKIVINEDQFSISKNLEFTIFRVIQEFINNSITHGKSSKINIKITADKKELAINLKDNGMGFDIAKVRKEGMGLLNVRSRVKSYNGSITINSAPNKGTHYLIIIPLTN
ncbi:MAG: PAS domain S-box protein [Bacteroidia bacterium]|nr:PAS domain S-box protein [Bacteroidia bacterium]